MTTFTPVLRPLLSADAASTGSGVVAQRSAWVAIAVVALCHIWLVSAGHWTHCPLYSDRYDRLAAAFASGQTHLTTAADPALLALPDPYDPVANESYRKAPGVHDACLYNGKLYYYWGPTSALLLTPGKLLLGEQFAIADQYLCFAFALGIVAVTALMLLRLRFEVFPNSPAWLPATGVLVAGLSTPITCIMTRAAVYEVAILGGQFFLLSGICLAWRAISKTQRTLRVGAMGCGTPLPVVSRDSEIVHGTAPHGTRTASTFASRRLLCSGLCLAAAVGSRVSLAVAVVVIGIVIVATIAWRSRRHPASALRPLLAFGLPLVAAAVGLCVYNAVRFEHPLQFGQKYQLAGANLLALPGLFGVDNLWPNLWSYFVRPIAGLGHFPFVIAVPGYGQFPTFITIPSGYEIYEPISGLPWVMPVLLAIPIAIIARLLEARTSSPAVATGDDIAANKKTVGDACAPRWLASLLLLAAVLGFAPVLLMIGSSQRYLADFTPPLVIVAMIAVWRMTDPSRTTPKQSRRRLAVFASLSAVTVAVGVLISVEGYGAHFRLKNPDLFQHLSGFPIEHAGGCAPGLLAETSGAGIERGPGAQPPACDSSASIVNIDSTSTDLIHATH